MKEKIIKGNLTFDESNGKYKFESFDKSKKQLLSCSDKIRIANCWGTVEHETDSGYYFLADNGEKIILSKIEYIEISYIDY